MKNWIYILVIGLMGSLVSSCQQSLDEEVQAPQQKDGKAAISLRLVLDGMSAGSRATWEENESGNTGQLGSYLENEIDLSHQDNLRVFIYTAGGELLGEVGDKLLLRLDQQNGRVYTLDGTLKIEEENLVNGAANYKVMVYANCGNNLSTFEYSEESNYIPMWGVKTVQMNLTQEETIRLGDIYLLRALAKVEVKLDQEIAEEFNLDMVTVNKYNQYGHVLPAGAASATATEVMEQDLVFHPNTTSLGTDLGFIRLSDNAFYVYLPEYQNVDNPSPATISVVINGNPYTIDFKNYVNGSATGDAYNIVRNHYYQYTITSVKTDIEVNLGLSYQVVPWSYGENADEEVDVNVPSFN